MTKYISILRGVNVGGNRKILMVNLKSLYEKLHFLNVKTYIQSGNVIFESEQMETNVDLEEKIHHSILETFGFDVPVIVRTADEWFESIAINPFLKEQNVDIEKLHLTILKTVPSSDLVVKLKEYEFSSDRFEPNGTDVYVYCENGYGRTKINNDFFEKKLKTSATTRNWKTVMKLNELLTC